MKNIKIWEMPSNNWQYELTYYTNNSYSCEESGCDSICRCGVITDICIENVNINEVLARIVFSLKTKQKPDLINHIQKKTYFKFFEYGVDRLIRFHKFYDTNLYDYIKCGGYYGEELDAITFNGYDSFREDVSKFLSFSPNKKIEFLLEKEYGKVLPQYLNREWKEEVVPSNKLIINQNLKINKEEYYKNYNLPVGLYKKKDNKYYIIDGHHRYIELILKDHKKEVPIIYCD